MRRLRRPQLALIVLLLLLALGYLITSLRSDRHPNPKPSPSSSSRLVMAPTPIRSSV